MQTKKTLTIHGVFLNIFGVGTLLKGKSGIGKSELALALLDRGHQLIADDAILFQCTSENSLLGYCPSLLQNIITIQGCGAFDVSKIFNDQAILPHQTLSLIIYLTDSGDQLSQEIEYPSRFEDILGNNIVCYDLVIEKARFPELLIECIVKRHILKIQGHDMGAQLVKSHAKLLGCVSS
jgi:HPr kinase/phosphorylase